MATRGGSRPGAGRPRKTGGIYESAFDYLKAVACGHEPPMTGRIQAAKVLLPYERGEVQQPKGKKEVTVEKAKQASEGVFSTSAAPKLVVDNA